MGTFLPNGANLRTVEIDGHSVHPVVHHPRVRAVHDRGWSHLSLTSGQRWTQVATYRVPHVAVVDSGGRPVYRLDIDPRTPSSKRRSTCT